MFFTITKVDQARREVGGIISCQKEDKDGETLDYEGSKPHFQAWSDEAYNATKALGPGNVSYGNLREQHSKRCVGKFVDPIAFDDQKKTIYGVAKVYDDDVWQKVSEGVYNAFSVGGGLVGPPKRSGNTKLITIVPREISLVDNPCLDATHFDFVRAADGSTVQKLFKSHDDQSRLKSALENLEKALKAYYTGDNPDPALSPVPNATENGSRVAPESETYAPDAINDKTSPHANQPADGQAHLSAEARTYDATAAHRVGEPDTQLGLHDSEPKADMISSHAEKRAVSDKERSDLADKGKAMPDGSYPIANASDLENAIQAFGRAKDPEAVKRHIKRRARQLDREDLLPDTWKAAGNHREGTTKMTLQEAIDNGTAPSYCDPDSDDYDEDQCEQWCEDNDVDTDKLSKGAGTMNAVEKAARLSLHDHLSKIKAAVSKHKEMAAAHEASVHELCDKCMKLAGGPDFKPDTENAGGQPASGSSSAATDTEVKAAKAEIEKLVATVKTLTEKIDANDKAAKDATEKAAADKAAADKAAADKAAADKKAAEEREKAAKARKLGIVGDRSKAVATGQTATEKAAAAQKEAEETMSLAKAAFGVDVVKVNGEERIQRITPDGNAMDALYSKLAKRGQVPDGSAKSLGVA